MIILLQKRQKVFRRYSSLVNSEMDDKTALQKISQNISNELWGPAALGPSPCMLADGTWAKLNTQHNLRQNI